MPDEQKDQKKAAGMSIVDLLNEQIDALRAAMRDVSSALVMAQGPEVAGQIVKLASLRGVVEHEAALRAKT